MKFHFITAINIHPIDVHLIITLIITIIIEIKPGFKLPDFIPSGDIIESPPFFVLPWNCQSAF
jgi:hypothetical protein